MIRKRITKVEEREGEWTTVDYIEQKPKKKLLRPNYWLVYPEFIEIMSNLSGSEPKVLSYLVKNANKLNQIKISYKLLAKKLDMSEISIKKIMSKLSKLNIVKNLKGIVIINPTMINKGKKNANDLILQYMTIFDIKEKT
jgi:hypothetical protein